MNWIEHIIEPERLLLTWQPKDKEGDRTRRLVAELVKTEKGWIDLHYLVHTQDYDHAKKLGFQGYPAFPLERPSYQNVMDVFMRRLPPRSRGDFSLYLESIRIHRDAKLSDFALLGYSGAKLPDDDFNVVHSFESVRGPFEFLTEISGFRYHGMNVLNSLKLGSIVCLKPEPENQNDPQAIQVMYDNQKLGYINRAQAPSFHSWLNSHRIKKTIIERKNGSMDRPSVYIFVSVS